METIILSVITGVIGWFLASHLDKSPTAIYQKQEKAERDERNKRLQELEDDTHYHDFETKKLRRDLRKITKEYILTKEAIKENPRLQNCVTQDKLEAISDEYKQYLKMGVALKATDYTLSKEEYVIKDENPIYCGDWSEMCQLYVPFKPYLAYGESLGRYGEGNMQKKIAEEFKEKWY